MHPSIRSHPGNRPVILAVVALTLFLAVPAGTLTIPSPRDSSAYRSTTDIRLQRFGFDRLYQSYSRQQFEAMSRSGKAAVDLMDQALAQRATDTPALKVDRSPLTGGAEVVRGARGYITAPDPGKSATDLALAFLRGNAALYGISQKQAANLKVLGESKSPKNGMRMVRVEQAVHGLPVFQSEVRVIVDREGRLIRTVGRLVPGADESVVPSPRGLISAQEGLQSAMASVGIELDATRMNLRNSSPSGFSAEVVTNDPRINRPVTSRVVYFPLGEGVLVPAWSQVTILSGPEAYYSVVDGRTGTLLFRKNLYLSFSSEEARFSVYTLPDSKPINPAPGSPNSLRQTSSTQFPAIARRTESMLTVQDPTASPDGWIPDGGSTTTGNNADVFLDRDGDESPDLGTLDLDGRPIGNTDVNGHNRDFLGALPRDFSYTPAPMGSNPDAGDDPQTAPYQRGAAANMFYAINWYHDRLYGLGFDEAAGNYQTDNFGRGGTGGDPVKGALQNQAGFGCSFCFNSGGWMPTPDGTSPVLLSNVWNGPTPDREGGLDADFLLHELTHGLSTRLLGNAAGLNFLVGGGLGEGWSDFYSQALLHDQQSEDPNAQYPETTYTMYRYRGSSFLGNYVYGTRRFPYSTDKRVNPLTWADADPATFNLSGGFRPSTSLFHPPNWAFEVHNLGEIWATSLWGVRSRIIAANGGNVPLGNEITLQLVTDAMKLTPIDPSFIEARDAILDADCATNACANEDSIWGGFATRGLGHGADTSSSMAEQIGVTESFALPSLSVDTVTVNDSAGNNNGFIDPGETISLTVGLFNPWRSPSRNVASASAILSSHTMVVGSITDKNSSYGPIPAQGTTTGDPFVFNLSSGATCGQSLTFNLKISTSPQTSMASFALRVGQPVGPGAPVVFQRVVPHGGLAIPDSGSAGVTDTLTVSADLVIHDLDFQVDSLTHPFVGNLDIGLKAPDGFGASLINRMGVCSPTSCGQGTNDGDNLINTRIDDSSTNDLFGVGPAAAPFTGSWFATINSPRLFVFAPDPVPELSRYQGRGTQGDWKLSVIDLSFNNVGSLNSWSLIVTPETFACSP